MAASLPPNATDEELEKQAEEMASKALPASLPEKVRQAKIPAIKQKILERLKAQRTEQAARANALVTQPQVASGAASEAAPAPPPRGAASMGMMGGAPPPPPPPDAGAVEEIPKVPGVELCGEEAWFANPLIRRRLREAVVEAHKEQKILVGNPRDEVERICPSDGRVLGAGAILRLGGAHLGGYGESDIQYAYRQLSRALHPDKNPDIAAAPAAFHRLSVASDEMKQGLTEQRSALQLIVSTMGGQATPEMMARPQEALFAEAVRMLVAVCSGVGEGEVPAAALPRANAAFARSTVFHTCQLQKLVSEWFERPKLVEIYGSANLRTAYDCAQKSYRAQFLCLLNRAVIVEAKRCSGCVRGAWSQIMQTFPELGIWREFRELIQQRVWACGQDADGGRLPSLSPSRSRSPSERKRKRNGADKKGGREEPPKSAKDVQWDARWKSSDDTIVEAAVPEVPVKAHDAKRERRKKIRGHVVNGNTACRWARKWRTAMAGVLPSSAKAGAPATDKQVRKLGAMLWKDIAKWAERGSSDAAGRGLSLFKADHQTSKTFGWENKEGASSEVPAEKSDWAFLPLADLFLVVGDGLVGLTSEGLFAESPASHKRRKVGECYKKPGEDQRRAEAMRKKAERRARRAAGADDRPARKSAWDK
eukprot:TRINITY_DN38390_c0_g1_i1.p1 TRINITY_DN38390_c0_g1~~TRINITY_DN38390_c0_g1_i1.p1  ORF type:complete len:651 (-),score=170.69 TRINITY_DN38390_c0_g1_i1:49-2001(-)